MGSSRGAMVRVVMELRKGQEVFMLVGQEGTNACIKVTLNYSNFRKSSQNNFRLWIIKVTHRVYHPGTTTLVEFERY